MTPSKKNMGPSTPLGVNRPPIVTVVGHIDHGKSTLLDYIRKASVTESEAGGITQHLSAYQAIHKNVSGEHSITFLDTPGHEAFGAMRSRGLKVADVAILVVSAEEGVKPQTKEALKLIEEATIPYIVAFTKIDKPGTNLERAKLSMLEAGVYLEGMGGEVPFVAVSGKSGEGVPELLDLILLAAELQGLGANPERSGEGLVIEAHVDQRRGNTATLIVHDGTVRAGEFVVAGEALAPVRIMENFLGKGIKEAGPGAPVRIVGFSTLPQVGMPFKTVETKKEAEGDVEEFRNRTSALVRSRPLGQALHSLQGVAPSGSDGSAAEEPEEVQKLILPLVIKTDVAGTGEAVVHELDKLLSAKGGSASGGKDPAMEVRVVLRSVGTVTEGDVRLVGGGATPGIIVGFNVKVESTARDLAERQGVTVATFDIIYKLAEWLKAEVERRRPRMRREVTLGQAKILKFFSTQKGRVVLGGRVEQGVLREGVEVKLTRRDIELGRGKIVSLQSQRREVKEVEAGAEFGAMLKIDATPAAGDKLEAFTVEMQ